MEHKNDDEPEIKYKRFHETFKLCTLGLASAFVYPNRYNVLKRAITITLIISFNGAEVFWFITYTFKCLHTLDIYNFARNITLAVILVLFFFKTYYMIYATPKFADLLDKISEDYIAANYLDEDYQQLYDDHLKESNAIEFAWFVFPIALSALFPIHAGILMSIDTMENDDFYVRRMVHDMDLLFIENIQNESPFFELLFAYNCIQCVVLVPNYTGIDGSFCIATIHLRLKLKLMTLKVEKAFDTACNSYELKMKLREAIEDHKDALRFYGEIQNVYGAWLFALFMLTSFMISFNLYQIHLLQRIDPKSTLFMLFGIFHIYLPCRYASTLVKVGEDTPDLLYCVAWEKWADPVVTHLLIFMISRSQKSLILTGKGVVIFNMELFKSILQTSYSFFTLITA